MINGVLVERTVNEVLPALQTNADGLKEVLENLIKQYRSKQEEMEKWKVRFADFKLFSVLLTTQLQKKNNIQVVQQ